MRKIPANYAIALTAALGLFMAVLDNTIVNVALTPMASALKTDISTIQWVVTGYFLAQAAVIPAAGYFSNRFGSKRIFILCLAFFTLGSLLCGLAQNETMLIIFRIFQGIGGGALFPLAQAISFQAFKPSERAAASALVGIPVLLAPAFGPTIGGLLTVNFGWEYIFFINVPVGAVAVFLAYRIFPSDKPAEENKGKGFDYVGLALSIVGVLGIVYAFTMVSETQPGTATATNPRGDIYGWGYWGVWAFMSAGIVLLVAFALYELFVSKDPVLDLRLFKNYNFTISSVVAWLSAVVVFGSIFMMPVFLEQVRVPHLSALDAGLALMPQGLAAAVAVGFSGKLFNTLGIRYMVLIGSVLLIFSSWELSQLTPSTDGTTLMPWLIIRGLGFGLTAIPVQTLALQSISGPALAKGSSLFNVTRQIASSIGIALLATLFVQQTSQHATDLAKSALQTAGNAVADPNNPVVAAAREKLVAQAGTFGINDVFTFVTIGTVGMVLLAFALPSRKRKAEALEGETQHEPVFMAE
ncbi:MAG TPA: MDR family MFS transporter [Chloroflexia bacterium]|nr:MDR family MFS transporter [Chloroflexia bacterium]